MATLENLRDRITEQARKRDRVGQDLARAEAGLAQARSVLKKHNVTTVKEARARVRELEEQIDTTRREIERDVERIERELEPGAAH